VTAAEQRQLDDLVALVRAVLGDNLLGAYLFGSAALGGLRPRSDLDVLAVAKRPTSRAEKRRLVERLLALSGSPRPLELTIVAQAEVRPWRYPPRRDFQYGDWWRGAFERGDLEPWPAPEDPDLASLVTMALLADRPLFGPPPADVLDPVPRHDYVAAMLACVEGVVLELDSDTRNVLLTLARVWSSLGAGGVRSKDAAADWALERLPPEHRAVLSRARAVYLGGEEERWDDLAAQVRPHAEHVVGEIGRLAAGRS
jgi:predicted nucleotidyltransferase